MFADCLNGITSEYGLFISLFIGGLVGSLTHCSGMCGPLVLGQVGALPSEKKNTVATMLLPYHFGRITTYMALAVIFSGIVNLAAIYALPKTILSVFLLSLAALMFLISAVPGLAVMFPWFGRISLPLPSGLLARLSRPLSVSPTGLRGYMLGVILGFMPCGLVIAALMAASTASGPMMAAAAMLGFGLGTVPMLVSVGLGGGWIKRRWPVQAKVFSSIVMAVNSLVLFRLAMQMVI